MNIKRTLLLWLLKRQFPELWQYPRPLAGIALMPLYQTQAESEQPDRCSQYPDSKRGLSVLFLRDKAPQSEWKQNEAGCDSQLAVLGWKRWGG